MPLPQHLVGSVGWVSLCLLSGAVGRGKGSGWRVVRKRIVGTPGRILIEKERRLVARVRKRTSDMAPEFCLIYRSGHNDEAKKPPRASPLTF